MTEKPKAIISNRIYFKVPDQAYLDHIVKSLTYRIEKRIGRKSKVKQIEIIKNYKVLPGNIVSVPQGRTDLVPDGYEFVDKRVFNSVPFPLPKHDLRDSQQPVYDKVQDTCFINALVGWGRFCPTLK